jgi:hypothetical protein
VYRQKRYLGSTCAQYGAEPNYNWAPTCFLVIALGLSLDGRGADGGYMQLVRHCSSATMGEKKTSLDGSELTDVLL